MRGRVERREARWGQSWVRIIDEVIHWYRLNGVNARIKVGEIRKNEVPMNCIAFELPFDRSWFVILRWGPTGRRIACRSATKGGSIGACMRGSRSNIMI